MKYGAAIVMVSLLITALLGGVASGDNTTVTTTDSRYITDVGGLWTSESVPAYETYTPNTAYTAYTTSSVPSKYTSGITYTSSTTSKSVPVAKETAHTGDTATVSLSDYADRYSTYTQKWGVFTEFGTWYPTWNTFSKSVQLIRASPIIEDLSEILETDTFTVDLGGGTLTNGNRSISMAAPILAHLGDGEGNWSSVVGSFEALLTPTLQTADKIYVSNGAITYMGETHPVSESYFVYGAGTGLESGYSLTSTDTLTVTVDTYYVDYMDITQPVYSTASPVYLSPGYTVGRIDVLLTGTNGAGQTIPYSLFRIGDTDIMKTPTGWKVGDTDIGSWNQIYVSYTLTGMDVWGVTSYASMKDCTLTASPIHSLTCSTGLPSSTIRMTATPSAIGWQVERTDIDVGSAAGVMGNPSLDIHSYWPDMSSYSVQIRSVAMVGTTIDIGSWSAVCDPSTLTATWTSEEIVYIADLTAGFTVTRMPDGSTVLGYTPSGSKTTADFTLPSTTTNTYSMTGSWAFASDLYEVWQTTDTVWEWHPGQWSLSEMETAVVMIVMSMLGVLVCRGLGKKITISDWAVIIAMIAIAWCIV